MQVTANCTKKSEKNEFGLRFTKEKTTMDIISSSAQSRALINYSLTCVSSSDIMSDNQRKENSILLILNSRGAVKVFIKTCQRNISRQSLLF